MPAVTAKLNHVILRQVFPDSSVNGGKAKRSVYGYCMDFLCYLMTESLFLGEKSFRLYFHNQIGNVETTIQHVSNINCEENVQVDHVIASLKFQEMMVKPFFFFAAELLSTMLK